MIWDEYVGYRYSSWSVFIALAIVFLMLIILWQTVTDLFQDRSRDKRMGTYKGNLLKDLFASSLVWILLWIPLLGFVWLLAKIGI